MSAFSHDATEFATIFWILPKVNIGRDPSGPALAGFRAGALESGTFGCIRI